MVRPLVMLISIALSVAALAQAEAAPLRDHAQHAQQQSNHGRHAHQQNSKGYAASPADMGAQCRAQVGQIWPNKPTMYGGGDRQMERCSKPACRTAAGFRRTRRFPCGAPREQPTRGDFRW
jgi:hypothetical protein